MNADALDHWITEAVLYRLNTPDLEALLKKDDGTDNQLSDLLDRRKAQRLRLDGLVRDYATGLLSRDQLALAKTAGQGELDRLESEIHSLNRQRIGNGLVPVGQSLRTAWEANDSTEWRQSLLALVIDHIDVNASEKRSHYDVAGMRVRFDPNRIAVTWRV